MTRVSARPVSTTGSGTPRLTRRSRSAAMHEIRVSILSPEAADHGVAELWAAGELIGYTILEDTDLMLRIEPRRDRPPLVIGAHSLAQALSHAQHLLEHP